jgi:ATP-dependent RNA helicase DDX27
MRFRKYYAKRRKRRLDDTRQRKEGKVWKKGKRERDEGDEMREKGKGHPKKDKTKAKAKAKAKRPNKRRA